MSTQRVNALGLGILLAFLGLGASMSAMSQDKSCMTNSQGKMVCPAADTACLKNRYGDIVCSTPGGGIATDRYGEPVCGPGSCTPAGLREVVSRATGQGIFGHQGWAFL
jgi:hypothetical protein